MQQVTVELGTRRYPIYIGLSLLKNLHSYPPLAKGQRSVFIISNPTVAYLYLEQVKQALGPAYRGHYLMPDGEAHKNLSTYEQACTAVLESGLHRDGIILALGGGVVGDLAGFVAATYQRGVSFIQVPTTLLAQVDSSVGGKTAVNHPLGKNMIGAFYQPEAVFIDLETLRSLPEREYLAGLAEVVKYGIIADLNFFEWLEKNTTAILKREPQALRHLIQVSCETKAKVVAADETEQGIRALLNLGHTFGHVIEQTQGYGQWLHGEAVAAGMVIAAKLSKAMNLSSASDLRRTEHLIQSLSLPTQAPTLTWDDWKAGLYRDKKVLAGQVRFVLPTGLGSAIITEHPIDEALLKRLLTPP